MSKKLKNIIMHGSLIIIGIIWIYPFIWTISASLKGNTELINSGLSLIPETPQWSNYVDAWHGANFSGYFWNTVIITVATVLIVVVMCAMTGYALARVKFPGKTLFIVLITATMFIPKGYTIIPTYMVIKSLGLLNTLSGVILAESGGAHVLFILLFMAYFSKLPRELEESAMMDGAGFVRTFVQIILPLAKPIIASVSIIQFIWTWNSFFVPLVFTVNNPELRTLAVGMYTFIGEHTVNWVVMAAGATISLLPVIILFVVFQRHFVEGISGSVKG